MKTAGSAVPTPQFPRECAREFEPEEQMSRRFSLMARMGADIFFDRPGRQSRP